MQWECAISEPYRTEPYRTMQWKSAKACRAEPSRTVPCSGKAPKRAVPNRAVPYHAVEKRHKSRKSAVASFFKSGSGHDKKTVITGSQNCAMSSQVERPGSEMSTPDASGPLSKDLLTPSKYSSHRSLLYFVRPCEMKQYAIFTTLRQIVGATNWSKHCVAYAYKAQQTWCSLYIVGNMQKREGRKRSKKERKKLKDKKSVVTKPTKSACTMTEGTAKRRTSPCSGSMKAPPRWIYMQWVTEDTKGQTKDNIETTFKKTVKKKVETTLDDLIELFNGMLVKFKRHAFNIRQQYRYSRELKRNMAENECIIHVDFSENYICKYASDIQAVQFGASLEQATLHTGVLYVGPDAEPVCFSTISPSRLKGPPAIW
ncbi:hypothetical protein PO909_016351 [Leuciscus waleckii]